MKLTLPNGTIVSLPFSQSATAGYFAEKIEIDAQDVDRMRRMAKLDPERFQSVMLQFAARFTSRRIVGSGSDTYDAELHGHSVDGNMYRG